MFKIHIPIMETELHLTITMNASAAQSQHAFYTELFIQTDLRRVWHLHFPRSDE